MYPFIEVTAVAALAMYGVLRGARRHFDLVGICYIAFAVAFGGGTLRDLLLDRHPVFWIENDHLVWIVMAIAVAGSILPNLIARLEPVLWIPDALGLGLFSILGATYALDGGTGRLVACLMGVLTGSCGGVIADVTCNELPLVFAALRCTRPARFAVRRRLSSCASWASAIRWRWESALAWSLRCESAPCAGTGSCRRNLLRRSGEFHEVGGGAPGTCSLLASALALKKDVPSRTDLRKACNSQLS